MNDFQRKLIIALITMCFLTPVGIILPDLFNAGDAWGEWDLEQLERMIGFVPQGMERLYNIWKPPIPDYNFLHSGESSKIREVISYVLSAFIGALIVSGSIFLITKVMISKKVDN